MVDAVTTVPQGTEIGAPAPDFLKRPEDARGANALLSQYAAPMRLKIVQKMSKAPLDAPPYAVGDVVCTPSNDLVAKAGEAFLYVPIFFYPEWITTNPQGSDVWIKDRSLDPRCEIAQRSRDPNKRREPFPGDTTGEKFYKHLEVYHFMIMLLETPTGFGQGMQAVMSYMSSELKAGSALSTMIKQRGPDIACYGNVFQTATGNSTNAKGTWKGFKNTNPTTRSPWVDDAAMYARLKEEHELHKAAYLDKSILVPLDDGEVEETVRESGEY